MDQEQIALWNKTFENTSPEKMLEFFVEKYGARLALSSSLSIEDQVLTDMLWKIQPATRVFTLDTGRLFPETYSLIARTEAFYNNRIEVFFPDTQAVQQMVKEEGINLFYNSIESRKRCCHVRKIEPLERAFQTLDVWVCGLRKEQSVTRTHVHKVEWDEMHQLVKLNPLADFSEKEVWDYIRQHGVPYNKLHDQGFPSIGCQPCTRAVQEGEDIRAGRWWWESPDQKECGLHRR